MTTQQKQVLIVGAGPAGLTAAYELLAAGIKPIVIEQSNTVGGISRTVEFNGNRMDIGGHRFFSKSAWVTNWWQNIMELSAEAEVKGPSDWLTRARLSRIYYLRKFFDYPLKLSAHTIKNLGAVRIAKIGYGYMHARVCPRKPEVNLEDFLYNRFGWQLYKTFFKDYTEKVWGVPCNQISADWGAQRIKGLSITKALTHALKSAFGLVPKQVNTSLIEKFQYPRLGPGQLWEKVARYIVAQGGEIRFNTTLQELSVDGTRVVGARLSTPHGTGYVPIDSVFSSMPIKDLVAALRHESLDLEVPLDVRQVAENLPYRDFLTIGVLVRKKLNLPDNWIYVQEPDVKLGRIQVFNNWSPDLVANPDTTWLGLEYFCQEGDEFWAKTDDALKTQAIDELVKLNLVSKVDIDSTQCCVIRVPKAYPAYFGAYSNFDKVRDYLDKIDNLFLMGRNGQHRYNNQDHSMLTAKRAVEVYLGVGSKSDIWAVNIDDDYHESTDKE